MTLSTTKSKLEKIGRQSMGSEPVSLDKNDTVSN